MIFFLRANGTDTLILNVFYFLLRNRIICDATQTPSIKTKTAQLKFLEDLAKVYCKASEFPVQPPAEKAMLKVVQLSSDQKSKEMRLQAQQCLFALYNCNAPNVSVLSFLFFILFNLLKSMFGLGYNDFNQSAKEPSG